MPDTTEKTEPVDIQAGALAAMDEALKAEPPSGDELLPEPGAASEPEVAEAPAEEPVPDEEPPAEELPPADEATTEAEKLGIKNEKANTEFKRLWNESKEFAKVKEELPVLRDLAEKYDQFIGHIESTGATPDQFGLAIGLINAINKGGPNEWAMAEKELENQLNHVRTKLGRADGQDPLSAHEDLRRDVEEGNVTRSRAIEIANYRNLQNLSQQHQTQVQRQTQQQTVAQQRALQQGVSDLNALEQELKAEDPNYAAKRNTALAEFIKVKDSVHPTKWEATFLKIYSKVQAPKPKPPVTTVPLRTQGAPGTVARVAASPEDAMAMALGDYDKGVRA